MNDFNNHKIDILCATNWSRWESPIPPTSLLRELSAFGLLNSTNYVVEWFVVIAILLFCCHRKQKDKTRDRPRPRQNGFELAEHDLQFRGSGELYGGKQSGLSDLGMEAIRNLKLVKAARNEARHLVETNPDYQKLSSCCRTCGNGLVRFAYDNVLKSRKAALPEPFYFNWLSKVE